MLVADHVYGFGAVSTDVCLVSRWCAVDQILHMSMVTEQRFMQEEGAKPYQRMICRSSIYYSKFVTASINSRARYLAAGCPSLSMRYLDMLKIPYTLPEFQDAATIGRQPLLQLYNRTTW